MRLRPSVRRVSRWFFLQPIVDRCLLDLEARHHWLTSARALSSAAGATSSTGRPRRAATASGSSSERSASTVACTMLIWFDEPSDLLEHVVDAGALQHGAHRATGDHTGTGSSRTEHDDARGLLTLDGVRDGALDCAGP